MDVAPAARTTLRLLDGGARGLLRGLAWTLRTAWTHRSRLSAVFLRVAWWASLWLAIETASTLVDVRVPLSVEDTLTRFAVGLGLCWALVVFAAARRLRWAAIALGTIHGGLAVLLWTVSGSG
ncbi:MAG: hypothetical protein KUG77_13385 [Nannocystaceae bacterium]|nr:hypothetical protein [Nannocystaceae bacterium]